MDFLSGSTLPCTTVFGVHYKHLVASEVACSLGTFLCQQDIGHTDIAMTAAVDDACSGISTKSGRRSWIGIIARTRACILQTLPATHFFPRNGHPVSSYATCTHPKSSVDASTRGSRVPSLLLSAARVWMCSRRATTFLIQTLHGSFNGVPMCPGLWACMRDLQ
jgi:hypothetical protein